MIERSGCAFQRALSAWAIVGSLMVAPRTHAEEPRAAATANEREEAHRRFDRGLSLYEASDFSGALAEFQRAYQLNPHPAVLYNVILVEARLGHAAEVVTAFERLTPHLGELGEERAERARKIHEEQLQRIGTLEIAPSIAGATIRVDHVEVPKDVRSVRVTAGTHIVSLSAPGYVARNLSVSVAAGARELVTVEMLPVAVSPASGRETSPPADVDEHERGALLARTPPASEEHVSRARTQRTIAFVSGGTGLVLAAAGAGFLLWNQGEKNDAQANFDASAAQAEAMPNGSCGPACQLELAVLLDDLDRKGKRDLYGWLGVGIGGAALAAGAFLYFLGPDPHRDQPTTERPPLARTRVELGPTAARFSLSF